MDRSWGDKSGGVSGGSEKSFMNRLNVMNAAWLSRRLHASVFLEDKNDL